MSEFVDEEEPSFPEEKAISHSEPWRSSSPALTYGVSGRYSTEPPKSSEDTENVIPEIGPSESSTRVKEDNKLVETFEKQLELQKAEVFCAEFLSSHGANAASDVFSGVTEDTSKREACSVKVMIYIWADFHVSFIKNAFFQLVTGQ